MIRLFADERDRERVAVAVLALGGSIESVLAPDGTKEIVERIADLVAEVSDPAATAIVERIALKPSFALELDDLLLLLRCVTKLPSDVVPLVTCGTDLVEEVALALACFAPPQGVVIAATFAHADSELARRSLADGLGLARSERLPRGCAVVAIDGAIVPAKKASEDELLRATAAPAGPVIAAPITIPLKVRADALREGRTRPTVAVIAATVGTPPSAIAELATSADILITSGFGRGNLNPELARLVEQRGQARLVSILCSSTPALPVGIVSSEYGGVEGLLRSGAWSAGSLSPRKVALLSTLFGGATAIQAAVLHDVIDRVAA